MEVILLTGPGGSGKTTVAEIIRDEYSYSLIDGDQLDTEFFPNGGQRDIKNKEQLFLAHEKILLAAKNEFSLGKNVVVDYIIFGNYHDFINKFRDEFGDSLKIKVLFPSEKDNIKRDKTRSCWTTGASRIKLVREEFLKRREFIGFKNFIDTSNQDPKETAKLVIDGSA